MGVSENLRLVAVLCVASSNVAAPSGFAGGSQGFRTRIESLNDPTWTSPNGVMGETTIENPSGLDFVLGVQILFGQWRLYLFLVTYQMTQWGTTADPQKD